MGKTATPEIDTPIAQAGDVVSYLSADGKERVALVVATPESRPDLHLAEGQVRVLVFRASSGTSYLRTATFNEDTGQWSRSLATVYAMNGGADYPGYMTDPHHGQEHTGPSEVDGDGSGLSDL